MHKIIKYLRPYIWSIIAILILLFGQAMPIFAASLCPDSNIGIQQSGIENRCRSYTSNEMGKLTLFMTENEKASQWRLYLLDRQSLSTADYSNYVKTYPQLANSRYTGEDNDNTQINQLNGIFNKYIPVLVTIEKGGQPLFGTPASAGFSSPIM